MEASASELTSFLLDNVSINSTESLKKNKIKVNQRSKKKTDIVKEVISETYTTTLIKPDEPVEKQLKQNKITAKKNLFVDRNDEEFFNSMFENSATLEPNEDNKLKDSNSKKNKKNKKSKKLDNKKESENKKSAINSKQNGSENKKSIIIIKSSENGKKEISVKQPIVKTEKTVKSESSEAIKPEIKPLSIQAEFEILLQRKNQIKKDMFDLEESLLSAIEPEDELDDDVLTMFRDYLQQAIFIEHYKRDFDEFSKNDINGDFAMILSKKFELLSVKQKISNFEKQMNRDKDPKSKKSNTPKSNHKRKTQTQKTKKTNTNQN
ncbi:hypothetical protein HANVADRAFT_102294 [Hanseniaspora valbyensis NRRL Y-1626]|uniref:Uncharacterized protein n=1 Tax=Hanseniaspora valbyensis NRRL Y-1626 TaxID=766949 RepID=A0A1B7TAM1_9ASCO|nr:hypothetical protein HANVADRAFT_102294 [Hanseniaspora valbyensis NRRL Y-1626]